MDFTRHPIPWLRLVPGPWQLQRAFTKRQQGGGSRQQDIQDGLGHLAPDNGDSSSRRLPQTARLANGETRKREKVINTMLYENAWFNSYSWFSFFRPRSPHASADVRLKRIFVFGLNTRWRGLSPLNPVEEKCTGVAIKTHPHTCTMLDRDMSY